MTSANGASIAKRPASSPADSSQLKRLKPLGDPSATHESPSSTTHQFSRTTRSTQKSKMPEPDLISFLPSYLVAQIQASTTRLEWEAKVRWTIAFIFYKVRSLSDFAISNLLPHFQPTRGNVVDATSIGFQFVRGLVEEIQTNIVEIHEYLAGIYIQTPNGVSWRKSFIKNKRRPSVKLNVSSIDQALGLTRKELELVWAPIVSKVHPAHWNPDTGSNHNGFISRDYTDEMRSVTLELVRRITSAMYSGRKEKTLGNGCRLRFLEDSSNFSSQLPWPELPPSHEMPQGPEQWCALPVHFLQTRTMFSWNAFSERMCEIANIKLDGARSQKRTSQSVQDPIGEGFSVGSAPDNPFDIGSDSEIPSPDVKHSQPIGNSSTNSGDQTLHHQNGQGPQGSDSFEDDVGETAGEDNGYSSDEVTEHEPSMPISFGSERLMVSEENFRRIRLLTQDISQQDMHKVAAVLESESGWEDITSRAILLARLSPIGLASYSIELLKQCNQSGQAAIIALEKRKSRNFELIKEIESEKQNALADLDLYRCLRAGFEESSFALSGQYNQRNQQESHKYYTPPQPGQPGREKSASRRLANVKKLDPLYRNPGPNMALNGRGPLTVPPPPPPPPSLRSSDGHTGPHGYNGDVGDVRASNHSHYMNVSGSSTQRGPPEQPFSEGRQHQSFRGYTSPDIRGGYGQHDANGYGRGYQYGPYMGERSSHMDGEVYRPAFNSPRQPYNDHRRGNVPGPYDHGYLNRYEQRHGDISVSPSPIPCDGYKGNGGISEPRLNGSQFNPPNMAASHARVYPTQYETGGHRFPPSSSPGYGPDDQVSTSSANGNASSPTLPPHAYPPPIHAQSRIRPGTMSPEAPEPAPIRLEASQPAPSPPDVSIPTPTQSEISRLTGSERPHAMAPQSEQTPRASSDIPFHPRPNNRSEDAEMKTLLD